MMEPESSEDDESSLVEPPPGLSGSPPRGDGDPEGGASQASYNRRSASRVARLQASPKTAASNESSAECATSDSDSFQSRDEWECAEDVLPQLGQASNSSSLAVLDVEQGELEQLPNLPETLICAAAVGSYAEKKFVVGEAEPKDCAPIYPGCTATNKLVKLAADYFHMLTKARVDELSKSFGNFDRVVGLGWLLADAVGCRQVSRAVAHALGLKARKLAVTTACHPAGGR